MDNEYWVTIFTSQKSPLIGSGKKVCSNAYNQSWSILLLAFKIKSEIRIRMPGD